MPQTLFKVELHNWKVGNITDDAFHIAAALDAFEPMI